nr:hypothetical protein [Tanacetum cinerariifolium]
MQLESGNDASTTVEDSYEAEPVKRTSKPYPLVDGCLMEKVKEKQENDKIGTKPNKNGKRRKAQQCQNPVTVKKEGKEKKIQIKRTKNGNPKVVLNSR